MGINERGRKWPWVGGGEGGCRRWWEVRLTVGVGSAEEGGCCRGLEGGGRFVVARGG